MIIVTGVKGQLGYDVCKRLTSQNIPNIGVDIDDFDITDLSAVQEYMAKQSDIQAVVHCAAYTAVDKAEDEEEVCHRVNVTGTKNIALVCKELGCKLVHISTDYVFSGEGDTAYQIDDEKAPVGIYGKTKLQGEEIARELVDRLFILRISWVFGVNGNNFVKTMLRIGKEKDEINVVDDQIGSPTYTKDLAVLICDMLATVRYGVYHATNEGYCSWAEFAREIFKQAGMDVKVNGIKSSEYPTKARRPLNSRLSKDSLDKNGFKRLPTWQHALCDYIKELNTI